MVRETRYLWLQNLPDRTNENLLAESFRKYGRIHSIKLHYNKDGKTLDALLSFLDIRSAAKAHNSDTYVNGVLIHTQYKEPPHFNQSITPVAPQQPRPEGQNQLSSPSRATDVPVCPSQMTYLGALDSNSNFSRTQTSYSSASSRSNYLEKNATTIHRDEIIREFKVSKYHQENSSCNQTCPPLLSPASSTTSASTDSVFRDGMHGVAFRGFPAFLSDAMIKDALSHQYKRFGTILSVDIINSSSLNGERIAVLTFSSFEDVVSCLENSHNDKVLGHPIVTTPHKGFCNVTRRDQQQTLNDEKLVTRTLSIPNNNGQLTKEKIQHAFSKYGSILDIDIQALERNGGLVFVEMDYMSSAIEASKNLFNNLKLKVAHCKSRSSNILLIENLNSSTSQKSLHHQLLRYSSHIQECLYDRRSGRALIIYETSRHAQRSLQQLVGRELFGSYIRVDFANEKHISLFKDLLGICDSKNLTNPLNHPRLNQEYLNRDIYNCKSSCSSSSESVTASDHPGRKTSDSMQSPILTKDIDDDDVFIVSVKPGSEFKQRFSKLDDSERSRSSSTELPKKQTLAEYFYISTSNRTSSNSSTKDAGNDISVRNKHESYNKNVDLQLKQKNVMDPKSSQLNKTSQFSEKFKYVENNEVTKDKLFESSISRNNVPKNITLERKISAEINTKHISGKDDYTIASNQRASIISSASTSSLTSRHNNPTHDKTNKFSNSSSRILPTSPVLISWIALTSSLADPRLSHRHYGEKCKKYSSLPLTKFTRELYSQISQKKTLIDATLKELQKNKDSSTENLIKDKEEMEKIFVNTCNSVICLGSINNETNQLIGINENKLSSEADIVNSITNLSQCLDEHDIIEENSEEYKFNVAINQIQTSIISNLDNSQDIVDIENNKLKEVKSNLFSSHFKQNTSVILEKINKPNEILKIDELDKNHLSLDDLSEHILNNEEDLKQITKTIINENCILTKNLENIEVTISNLTTENTIIMKDKIIDVKETPNTECKNYLATVSKQRENKKDYTIKIVNEEEVKNKLETFINMEKNIELDKSHVSTVLKTVNQINSVDLTATSKNKKNIDAKLKAVNSLPVTKSLTKLFQLPNDICINKETNNTCSKAICFSQSLSDKLKTENNQINKLKTPSSNHSSTNNITNKITNKILDTQSNINTKSSKDYLKFDKSEDELIKKLENSKNLIKSTNQIKKHLNEINKNYDKEKCDNQTFSKNKNEKTESIMKKNENSKNVNKSLKFNIDGKHSNNEISHKIGLNDKNKLDKIDKNKLCLRDIKENNESKSRCQINDKQIITKPLNNQEKQVNDHKPNDNLCKVKDLKEKSNNIIKDQKLLKRTIEDSINESKTNNKIEAKFSDISIKKECKDKSAIDKTSEILHNSLISVIDKEMKMSTDCKKISKETEKDLKENKHNGEKCKMDSERRRDSISTKKHNEDKRELKALLDGCPELPAYVSMYDMVKRRSCKETSTKNSLDKVSRFKNQGEYKRIKNHSKSNKKDSTIRNEDSSMDKNRSDDDSISDSTYDSYTSSDNDSFKKSENVKPITNNIANLNHKNHKNRYDDLKIQTSCNDSNDSKSSISTIDLKSNEGSYKDEAMLNLNTNILINRRNSSCLSDSRSKIKAIIAAKHKKSNDIFGKIVNSIKTDVKLGSETDADTDEPPVLESQSQVLALLTSQHHSPTKFETHLKRCLSNEKIDSKPKKLKIDMEEIKINVEEIRIENIEISNFEESIKTEPSDILKTNRKMLSIADFRHSSLHCLDEIYYSIASNIPSVEKASLKHDVYVFEYLDEYDLNVVEMPIVKCGPCPMPLNSLFDFKSDEENVLEENDGIKIVIQKPQELLINVAQMQQFNHSISEDITIIPFQKEESKDFLSISLVPVNANETLISNILNEGIIYDEPENKSIDLQLNDFIPLENKVANNISIDLEMNSALENIKDNMIDNQINNCFLNTRDISLAMDSSQTIETAVKRVKNRKNKKEKCSNNNNVQRITRTRRNNFENQNQNQISLRSGNKLSTVANIEIRNKNKRINLTKSKKNDNTKKDLYDFEDEDDEAVIPEILTHIRKFKRLAPESMELPILATIDSKYISKNRSDVIVNKVKSNKRKSNKAKLTKEKIPKMNEFFNNNKLTPDNSDAEKISTIHFPLKLQIKDKTFCLNENTENMEIESATTIINSPIDLFNLPTDILENSSPLNLNDNSKMEIDAQFCELDQLQNINKMELCGKVASIISNNSNYNRSVDVISMNDNLQIDFTNLANLQIENVPNSFANLVKDESNCSEGTLTIIENEICEETELKQNELIIKNNNLKENFDIKIDYKDDFFTNIPTSINEDKMNEQKFNTNSSIGSKYNYDQNISIKEENKNSHIDLIAEISDTSTKPNAIEMGLIGSDSLLTDACISLISNIEDDSFVTISVTTENIATEIDFQQAEIEVQQTEEKQVISKQSKSKSADEFKSFNKVYEKTLTKEEDEMFGSRLNKLDLCNDVENDARQINCDYNEQNSPLNYIALLDNTIKDDRFGSCSHLNNTKADLHSLETTLTNLLPMEVRNNNEDINANVMNIESSLDATPENKDLIAADEDIFQKLLVKYPLVWQGYLSLKQDISCVQMHYVSGNKSFIDHVLTTRYQLRLAQRMRLEESQLDNIRKGMMHTDDYVMLVALPCGLNDEEIEKESGCLHTQFINYFIDKQAAGIVNLAKNDKDGLPGYVVHIFPPCPFSIEELWKRGPDLFENIINMVHMTIIIKPIINA